MKNEKSNDNEILELPEEFVEELVCKQLLSPLYPENALFVQQNFKSNWFKNDKIALLYKVLDNYWKKYNAEPTQDLIEKILSNDKLKDNKEVLSKIVR